MWDESSFHYLRYDPKHMTEVLYLTWKCFEYYDLIFIYSFIHTKKCYLFVFWLKSDSALKGPSAQKSVFFFVLSSDVWPWLCRMMHVQTSTLEGCFHICWSETLETSGTNTPERPYQWSRRRILKCKYVHINKLLINYHPLLIFFQSGGDE